MMNQPYDTPAYDNQATAPSDAAASPPATDSGLSTADMAAAADKPRPDQASAPRPAPEAKAPAIREQKGGQPEPLLAENEANGFRSRWDDIQAGFVDEPRRSVEQADALVAELMKRLARIFADERSKLEQQWGRGEDVSTEDLRVALKRYRSFFDRLLSL